MLSRCSIAARGVYVELRCYLISNRISTCRGTLQDISEIVRVDQSVVKLCLNSLANAEQIRVAEHHSSGQMEIEIPDISKKIRLSLTRTLLATERGKKKSVCRIGAQFSAQSGAQKKHQMVEGAASIRDGKTQVSSSDAKVVPTPNGAQIRAQSSPQQNPFVLSEGADNWTLANYVIQQWNMIPGVEQCTRSTDERKKRIVRRLQDPVWADSWERAIDLLSESGDADGKKIEWFISPKQVAAILGVKNTKKFFPPTIVEVESYCLEKGFQIDAEQFVSFYESKGWKVGTSPMKNWEAALRGWASRERASSRTVHTARMTVVEHNRTAFDEVFGRSE
ncbi:hypothetical protein SH668x_001196 [Planctomicrobium sp. SH668]|uniref:hypothetical protein n=1 Tax=Planctomicrobium sp. SH668 TaxID=3448126 RepID=UPI003F5CA8D7